MNILLIGAASSVHIMRWANAFVERGCIVHLATQHDPIAGFRQEVIMHRLPHFGGAGYFVNRPAIRKLIRRIKPDVMNAHYASGYGTLAIHDEHVPLVLNVWGSDVYEFPDSGRTQHRLLCRNLRRADAIVSTSEAMARRTSDICPGLPPITVVPFGVDTTLFTPAGLDTSRSAIVIGTVKTLKPTYGIDVLIRAFALLVERSGGGVHVRLKLVGTGSQAAELKALVDQLGVGSSVEFVGSVPHADVPDQLRSLDVYVALSRSESFGVAIIEASACGVPVVVSDVGGLPEVTIDGVTGFVVPPEDPEAAADRIAQLIGSADLRRAMGAAGRKHVEEQYAWSACVDKQLAVFDRVIAERKRK
ncbi:MAG: glycosyltransferase [Flavobacteriales bacterium]|nr:glycosyltransferase [Flavobacteriales bacterium]